MPRDRGNLLPLAAGVLVVSGYVPADRLYRLYAVLPVAVVLAIVRREIGVMALAALVVAFLALRGALIA